MLNAEVNAYRLNQQLIDSQDHYNQLNTELYFAKATNEAVKATLTQSQQRNTELANKLINRKRKLFEIKKTAAENYNKIELIYNEFKDTLYDIQPAIDALSDTNSIKLTVKAIKQYYIDQLNSAKAAYELTNQQNIEKQVTNYNAEAQAYIKNIQEKHIQEIKDTEEQYNAQLIALTTVNQEQVQNLRTIEEKSQTEIQNLKTHINTINQTLMQNQANLDHTNQQLLQQQRVAAHLTAQIAAANQLNRCNVGGGVFVRRRMPR